MERLASDPLPVSAGRVWFNTTEKAVKYSSLDAGGAVIIRIIANTEDVQAAIAALQTALDTEVTAREAGDTAEASARAAAITALQDALAQEVADRNAAIAAEATARDAAIAVETTNRVAADGVVASNASDALATEVQARLTGDAGLNTRIDTVQNELDVTQTAAGLNADGTLTAPESTKYLGTVETLKGGLVALDTALVAEEVARAAAFAAVASQLANEAQLRTDGDANLQAQLEALVLSAVGDNAEGDAAEAAARIAGDAGLQTELDQTQASIGLNTDGTMGSLAGTNFMSDATSVFSAAFALDTQLKVVTDGIAAEVTARSTADTEFTTALNTEIATRISQDAAIGTEIDATQAGAGLEADGSYAAPTGSNYLNASVSLKDAALVLDSAVKSVAEGVAANTAAISANSTALAAETAAREAADTAEVTARDAAIAAAVATETAAREAADTAEVTARTEADTALDTAIKAVDARVSALGAGSITSLQGELDASQASLGLSADGSMLPFSGDLAEAGSFRGAIESLLTMHNDDVSALSVVEGKADATQAAVEAEVTRATGVEASLQSQIDGVVAASGEGAAALKTTLNSGRHNFVAPAAALVHTVNHNLATDHILFNIMVEGTDGVFRNDIVPVEELSNNALRIALTEARRIKVSVMSLAALA
jgi:hypothetical protein